MHGLTVHAPPPSAPLPAPAPNVATAAPVPLVADAKALAVMLGLGLRTVRAHDSAGKLPRPIRLGGRVVWLVDEVRSWLAAGAPERTEWEARKRAGGGRR